MIHRKTLGNPVQCDFSETITYKDEKVFFYTMGDFPKELEHAMTEALNDNDKDKVTIFICACSLLTPALRILLQNNRTTLVSKTVSVIPNQQLAFNIADAQTILNLM